MKIETKFNIGDKVWFIKDNNVNRYEVCYISTFSGNGDVHISYSLDGIAINPYDWVDEDKLFPTKEELLKSL